MTLINLFVDGRAVQLSVVRNASCLLANGFYRVNATAQVPNYGRENYAKLQTKMPQRQKIL